MTPYFQDDAVTIYHGDCREIVPTLGRFDLLLTDPPYGIGKWSANFTGGFMSKTEAEHLDWDKAPIRDDLLRLVARASVAILWGGNYLDLPPSPRVLVWDKQQQGMHFAEVEIAWTTLKTGTSRIKHYGIKSSEVFGAASERRHPTQKPLALMTWCIGLAGDVHTILDPFAGSGTTGRAAKDLGCKAVLIERKECYCEIAARRMAQGVLDLGSTTPKE
jgi:DNA modification methylase